MQTTASIADDKPEAPWAGPDAARAESLQTAPTAPSFHSILFADAGRKPRDEPAGPPEFFRDLNLDQIVDAIIAGREEYNLKPFFYTRLTSLDGIAYRHEVMRDLERTALCQSIKSFSARMHAMRGRLAAAAKSYYPHQQEALLLEAAEFYCEAVESLLRDLREHAPASRGLGRFGEYLARYAASEGFKALAAEARQVRSSLAAIRYALLIHGGSITVRNYEAEPDYTAAVETTFAKFKQGAANEYLAKFSALSDMNHVENMVLERVALLNPEAFRALADFCAKHKTYADETITAFDREIQFYVAWLEYADKFKGIGLKFCYPRVSDASKELLSREGFDLALAGRLVGGNSRVVCNDFALRGSERIIVVTGPNQGGKTTFARTFGQLHYLASLGLPVPGAEAELFLCDQLFTHFEREEDITNLRGKLEDDLVRIHAILQRATPGSLVVINEIFSSTTLQDAVFLGRRVIERIAQLDALCVCVTFLDELSRLNEKTVSLVAEVAPENPTLRTFKIQRRPADGLAYAMAIAEKYRVTYRHLKERLRP